MIYLDKYHKYNESREEYIEKLYKKFQKTDIYKAIERRLDPVVNISDVVLEDISGIILKKLKLSRDYSNNSHQYIKLIVPGSKSGVTGRPEPVISIYDSKAAERKEYFKFQEFSIFRFFISKKKMDCVIIKILDSYIDTFLGDDIEEEDNIVNKTSDINKMSNNQIIDSFIKTETWDLIQLKLRFLNYRLTQYTIDAITTVLATKYDLYAVGNLLSYDSDSDIIISVNKQTPKERKEFYKNGDWYIFRIFLNDDSNECLVIGVNKIFIEEFLSVKDKYKGSIAKAMSNTDRDSDFILRNLSVKNNPTPPPKPQPVKEPINFDKMKELLLKSRNKKLK